MRSVRSGSLTFLAVAVLVGTWLSSGKAQERTDRRSGPRDWSHSQIVASGWGADDPGVRRDWRTLRKHMTRDDARRRRMPMAQWMAWVMKNARRQAGATSTSTSDVKLDWSLNTGGTGSVIGYPAKFSFDVSASNCSDVIYFTVNQNGGATTPNVIAITNAVCRLPGQSAEPDADGEVGDPAAVRHRHLADAQPGRDRALRVRVADLGPTAGRFCTRST